MQKIIHDPKQIRQGHLYKSARKGEVWDDTVYLGVAYHDGSKHLVIVLVAPQHPASIIGEMVIDDPRNGIWVDGFIELGHIGK